jgi:hypothetical protein
MDLQIAVKTGWNLEHQTYAVNNHQTETCLKIFNSDLEAEAKQK